MKRIRRKEKKSLVKYQKKLLKEYQKRVQDFYLFTLNYNISYTL